MKTGYTTGTCAAAAAKGAILALAADQKVADVAVSLPDGGEAILPIRGAIRGEAPRGWVQCTVIKDAGDDPDITHRAEIAVTLWAGALPPPDLPGPLKGEGFSFPLSDGGVLRIEGGKGVGLVTKPGLSVPIGRPAINPVPLQMIRHEIEQVLESLRRSDIPAAAEEWREAGLTAVVSIPQGEELAARTLNGRLGIEGGISVLGTTGIVHPISHEAWRETVHCALAVARACGCPEVVLSTGRSSEKVAQACLILPPEAYVLMGDQVGFALQACVEKGFKRVTLAGQLAKLSKVASGHLSTHCQEVEMDWGRFASWASGQGGIRTGRSLAEAIHRGGAEELFPGLCQRVKEVCESFSNHQLEISVLLAGYHGEVLAWVKSM